MWATKTSKALGGSLDPVASAGGFKVDGLTCRDHTCSATLEWPSFTAAAQGYRAVLDADLSVNCGRALALVEDAVPGKPYRTTVVFDCADAKYGPT